MKSKVFFICFLLFLISTCTCYCATSDALSILEISHDVKNMYGSDCSAPFSITQKDEGVEESSGAVELKETDLHLPGKNGLDFNLIRRFNSQTVGKHYIRNGNFPTRERDHIKYYRYIFRVPGETKDRYLWIRFDKEKELFESTQFVSFTASLKDCLENEDKKLEGMEEFNAKKDDDPVTVTRDIEKAPLITTFKTDLIEYNYYYTKTDNIGYNFNYIYPKIIKQYSYTTSNGIEYDYCIFEDDTGRVVPFKYSFNNDDDSWYSESSMPYGYKLIFDDHFVVVEHELGFTYRFRINHISGKNYYFSTSGQIEAIIDKYGNCILYDQIDDGLRITDTYGRIIEVTSEGCTVTDGNKTYIVSYDKSVEHNSNDPYNQFTTDDIYKFTVTKTQKIDGVTVDTDSTKYFLTKIEIIPDFQTWGTYQYLATQSYNVDRIEYPSNVTVEYDYEILNKYYRYKNYLTNMEDEIHLVTERRVYENDILKSKTMYENDMLGIGKTIEDYNEDEYKNKRTITYSDSDLTVKQVYDKYYCKTKETRTFDNYKYEETYDYEEKYSYVIRCGPLKELCKKYYNGTTEHTLTVNYTYNNNWCNLLTETEGDKNITYTYSDDYNMLLTKTYNRDADTTVVITNTLTEDGKSVASTSVTENGVLKKKTDYTYNEYGDVIQEKEYRTDTAFTITNYTHSYTVSGKTITKSSHGITETFVYDIFGNLISATDGNGNITTYEYDMYNREIKKTNPDGTFVTTEYNMTDNYIITTDENGNKMKYQYSPSGNLTDAYVMNNGEYMLLEHNEYDSFDRQILNRRYTSANQYADTVCQYDDAGRRTTVSYKDYEGNVKYGINYSYEYNTYENYAGTIVTASLFGETTAPVMTTQYDYRQLPVSQTVTSEEEIIGTSAKYDYAGNKIEETDAEGNTIYYTYDFEGKPLTVTNAENNTYTKEYDKKGRMISETDFRGSVYEYSYDNNDRLVTRNFVTTSKTYPLNIYIYDNNGNVVTELENIQTYNTSDVPVYQTKNYEYDNRNRPVKVIQYTTQGMTINPEYTQYYYDGVGNIVRMYSGLTDALTINGLDNVTANGDSDYLTYKYEYDFLNRQTKMTDKANKYEQYTYDYKGNLLTKRHKDGSIITYSYDWRGNPVSLSSGNTSVAYTYNNYGNRVSMTDATGTTSYTYDGFLRPSTETKGNITKAYQYNDNSQRTRFTLSVGEQTPIDLTYNWNNVGLLSSLTSGDDVVNYTYNANGNLTEELLNEDVETSYAYLPIGYLLRVTNYITNDGNLYYSLNPYFVNGNKKSCTTNYSDGVITTNYTYDGLGRLTSEQAINGLISNTYTFDDKNNRTAITGKVEYGYNGDNTLLYYDKTDDIGYFEWNNDGTLKRKDYVEDNNIIVENYTYDGFNRLVQMTDNRSNTYTYEYDGDGRRTAKVVNGVRTDFVWDGDYIVAEITGGEITSYIRGTKLHMRKKGADTDYYLYNTHGDVIQLVNADGTIVAEYKYDAYGNQLNETTDQNPFRYCGEYYDAETGLIYLRARYYDTDSGRFISEDPIRDGLNWYVYCGNNPVNFVDPSGLYDLEYKEDGRVIAVIEEGDTLGSIAEAEVDDRFAYLRMKTWDGSDIPDYDSVVAGEGYDITGIYGGNYPNPNLNQKPSFLQNDWTYPLSTRHTLDPNTGNRQFGAPRGNGRLHAGMDLIVPQGTDVIAMTDGKVIDYNVGFYAGTDALIVQNNNGTLSVYGEIKSHLRAGATIVQGQQIGSVISNNVSGASMLHIEYYSGKASGSIFSGGPYRRRADLSNPSFIQYLP